MINQLKGKIVSYNGKKAKVISEFSIHIKIVLQENGKFKGDKINTSSKEVKLLDKVKHPRRYQEKRNFYKNLESDYEPATRKLSFTERIFETNDLYIDSRTKEAFEETGGGNYITQKELAGLGQIHRSSEGCDIFKSITNLNIGSKQGLRELFMATSQNQINLSLILKNPRLERYMSRTSQFAFD